GRGHAAADRHARRDARGLGAPADPRRAPRGERRAGPGGQAARRLRAEPLVPRQEAGDPGPHRAGVTSLAEAVAALVGRGAHLEGPLVVVLARIFVVAAALALAVAGHRIVARLIDRLLRPLEGAHDYPVKVQRARTLGPLMKNAAAYVLAFVTLVIVL